MKSQGVEIKLTKRVYKFSILVSFLIILYATFCLGHEEIDQRLIVAGVNNQSGDIEFDNLLISQGIISLVAQEFYNSGKYIPIEDNPEIIDSIHNLVTHSVTENQEIKRRNSIFSSKVLALASQIKSDALTSVTIKKLKKSRTRSMFGPFTTATVRIHLEVEVFLQKKGEPITSAIGRGTGSTKSQGVLFQIRADKVHFDKTSVGQALQQAIHQAVKLLTS